MARAGGLLFIRQGNRAPVSKATLPRNWEDPFYLPLMEQRNQAPVGQATLPRNWGQRFPIVPRLGLLHPSPPDTRPLPIPCLMCVKSGWIRAHLVGTNGLVESCVTA